MVQPRRTSFIWVLATLGFCLRAFTAKDRKDLEKAAQTYRDNPRFSTVDAIRDVGTGEAVTSMLDAKGVPMVVERTLIRPPSSQLGPIEPAFRAALMASSPMAGKYNARLDRDSAAEMLGRKADAAARQAEQAQADADGLKNAKRYDADRDDRPAGRSSRSGGDSSFGGKLASVVVKELTGTTGRRIVRGILGGLFRSR